ncbi:unnamed protein product [Closterium sp. Naga37s-1]|nr:unnamed protein product [Closterium sp. Naga37s-1]
MVDNLIRALAEHLGRSSPWHQRFHALQEVFTASNLELQGIHSVRWLSKGDAVLRLVYVSPAVIVMLSEYDLQMHELATSYRFHFLLFFIADVLEQLNVLNKTFQQHELDYAVVHAQIRRTTSYLESRYVDCGDDFGGGLSARLSPFITKHGPDGGCPKVTVKGVDSDGRPTTHEFVLHENPNEDFPTVGSHDACIDLCTAFAETLVRNLNSQFEDLQGLSGVRLFTPDEWLHGRVERYNQCLEWLRSLPNYDEVVQIWRSYKKRRPFCNFAAVPAVEGQGDSRGKEVAEEEEELEEMEQAWQGDNGSRSSGDSDSDY